MDKAWAIVDIDDTIVGCPFTTAEAAQRQIDSMSYFGDMLEVREINVNNEPLDDEGRELEKQLEAMMKNTIKLHISKGLKFYELSLKERYRAIINMMNAKGTRSTKAPSSDVEPVDVSELVKKL